MGLINSQTNLITPEVTAFHEVDTSIAMLFSGAAEVFLPAGTPICAANGADVIMNMTEPSGRVADLSPASTDLPTALLAHDVNYKPATANEEVSVAVVTRGVYYARNINAMLPAQVDSLEANGLYPYGVKTKI